MKELLKQLIQARSTPDAGERAAAEVIANHFRQHSVDCHVDTWQDNRANVVAHVKSSGQQPALLFICHLDVVSPGEETWQHDPFEAHEKNGQIYGRGAVDMKGPTTAAITAICDTVRSGSDLHGDIVFAATAGEETDSSGVIRLMQNRDWLPELAGVIVPEPTDFSVITAHRGMLWLRIATKGKAAHSSMPHRGINAIMSMKYLLDALEHYEVAHEPHPLLGQCSTSVNTIAGGEAMNIVPDRCVIGVDSRTLPGQDHDAIRYDIEQLLAKLKSNVPHFESTMSVDRSVQAMETDPQCPFVKDFCTAVDVDMTGAVGFTTDGPHLLPLDVPIVIYGPGKPGLCHQIDEHIALDDLRRGVNVFQNVIRTFLG
ncbi:MAG: M20 family metallopeptidase [Planctomycetota bacterium]|jgi:succinyl-diaminopimelate desuccinylase